MMAVLNFRPRHTVLQAVQFTGTNGGECARFIDACTIVWPLYLTGRFMFRDEDRQVHCANRGDWIIRGVTGKLWIVPDAAFHDRYEPVDAEENPT